MAEARATRVGQYIESKSNSVLATRTGQYIEFILTPPAQENVTRAGVYIEYKAIDATGSAWIRRRRQRRAIVRAR